MKQPDFLPKDPKKIPRPSTHTIVSDLPDYLKDHANYDKIQRALLETLATTHSHSDLFAWFQCPKCQKKLLEHRTLLKRLGFKNAGQYYAWKKIHEYIKNPKKKPLPKYNEPGLPTADWIDEANYG
jgi:alkylated DNA repair dioxygenase AlkB